MARRVYYWLPVSSQRRVGHSSRKIVESCNSLPISVEFNVLPSYTLEKRTTKPHYLINPPQYRSCYRCANKARSEANSFDSPRLDPAVRQATLLRPIFSVFDKHNLGCKLAHHDIPNMRAPLTIAQAFMINEGPTHRSFDRRNHEI